MNRRQFTFGAIASAIGASLASLTKSKSPVPAPIDSRSPLAIKTRGPATWTWSDDEPVGINMNTGQVITRGELAHKTELWRAVRERGYVFNTFTMKSQNEAGWDFDVQFQDC